ncbi:niemann pick type c1, putative [Ichthyophthirius multifiliis]|uniref:Niemann pick type c1, putative n=1 Tax=Ichthyophthirius multifiliis TaxID=5932 RepID=G0QVR2_ICHMU|nr:niemann pick type c1, putative [Ichthyophthirius multifiliis]EGR30695.1 niemann pick type c1, putative [Ichthyophthirius multifiliis]|eukprot:XP_004032282.1 niemann pick type c1, putative [Ichthyophthirius multifiliis]
MGFGNQFGKLAVISINNKFIVILFSIVITAVFSLGILNLKMESDPQKLWAPPSGRTYEEQRNFNKNFGEFFRVNQLIISAGENFKNSTNNESKSKLKSIKTCTNSKNRNLNDILKQQKDQEQQDLPNLFDIEPLKWLYYLQKVINTRSFQRNGQNVTADQLCYKPISNKGCLITSPMDYWKMNITLLNERANQDYIPPKDRIDPRKALQKDALCIEANTKTTLIPCTDSNSIPVIKEAVVGGSYCESYEHDDLPCSHCWLQAQALIVTYLFNNDKFTQDIANDWEKQVFADTVFAFRNKTLDFSKYLNETIEIDYKNVDNWPDLDVQFMAQRGISDDLVTEASQNLWVVALSYSLMFVYISISIGSFPSKTHSGFLIGFSGIVLVLFSIACSMGFMSFIKIGMTMISVEVIPFLILAIGVDNMFIISNAVKSAEGESLEERVRSGMTEVGPSITAAAISEILAFTVGMFTKIPALQTFCIQAAIAIFFLYQLGMNSEPERPREDFVKQMISKYYIPVLKNQMFHVFNLLLFIVLIVIGILGCLQLDTGLNQQVSLVSGSDLNNYFDKYNQYIEIGPLAYLVLQNIDYKNQNDIDVINQISNALSLLQETVQPPVFSWIATFNQFRNPKQMWATDCGTGDIDQYPFEVQVQKFIDVKVNSVCCQKYGICGEQFNKDIIFDADGNIKASRLRFQHKPVITSNDFIKAFQQTRQAVDNSNNFQPSNSNKNAYSYSLIYSYYDQYTEIRAVAIQNMLLAIGAVYIAINFIKNGIAAIIVSLNVFAITFNLIGISWLSNIILNGYKIEINAISVVNLVTCVGLSVEFCVHLVISYMNSQGTRQEKTENAVKLMGSNILVGIASTKFIGVIVLGFATSAMFRLYYFRMYMAIIFLGIFQGLMFLPTILMYIGPQTKGRDRKSFLHTSQLDDSDDNLEIKQKEI